MSSVRVAIVGVGNCAASLVQGVHYYRDADPTSTVPGLMHVQFGEYHVRDVEFVAAFDVDAKKVGFDLADAIKASENNTIKIADVPPLGVTVQRGRTLDGLGKYYRETITESDEQPVDLVQALKDAKADVLVSYLPVGSEQADKFYAQCAIDAGVAFVNALPVFIASDPEWAEKFEDAGVPIVGDDIKSQVGATITHRVLAKLFEDRGVVLDRTYQLNVGGNMDFKNMLERDRLESKKISKTQAVTSNIEHDLGGRNVHIGPSDYVQWLDDRKWAYVRLEGRAFGDVPLNMEYKLEVWDSPNSAGVIIDAVRAAKIAKDRGIGGPLLSPASHFMISEIPLHRLMVCLGVSSPTCGLWSGGATSGSSSPRVWSPKPGTARSRSAWRRSCSSAPNVPRPRRPPRPRSPWRSCPTRSWGPSPACSWTGGAVGRSCSWPTSCGPCWSSSSSRSCLAATSGSDSRSSSWPACR